MKSLFRIGLIFLTAALILCGSASAYYIGDQIKLSGVNPNTYEIYLYISGPNIPIQDIPTDGGGYVTTGTKPLGVNLDREWSAEFYLANRFDAGTYTIYVSAWPLDYSSGHYAVRDKNKELRTTTITLNGFTMTASAEGTKVSAEITNTETVVPEVSTSPVTAETKPTSSPIAALSIFAGLGAVVYLLRR